MLVTSEALLYPLTFFCLCPFVGNSDWNRRQIVSDDTKTSLETGREKKLSKKKTCSTAILTEFYSTNNDYPGLLLPIIKLPKAVGKAYPVILTSQVLKNNDQKPNNSTLIEPFFSTLQAQEIVNSSKFFPAHLPD